MKTTRIVTVFLTYKEKYLILKRSQKVRSMKNLWAGISGIIEGKEDPLFRAKREVWEEAGIPEDNITLLKEAPHMRVDSQYYDHEWTIYPFLFLLREPKITLNWENSEYAWITSSELSQYRTVPSLDKVLSSLL